MANSERNGNRGKSARQLEFESLSPSLQLRIRRTYLICGVWFGFIILSAAGFVLSKPYLDKRRLERMKQPDYKPLTHKSPVRFQSGRVKGDK